jgi:DNA uptake protein ComE-like DNA-binding protein
VTGALTPSAAATAEAPAPAPAPSGAINLNTASLEQLNSLRGGGRIGRAIIRGRPYASSEDLLKKRVLNRSAYERIKDQVTVAEQDPR